jgi:hypothetical protein
LVRDPTRRLRYGQAGRARVEQHFEIKKTIVPLLQLLQRSSVPRPKPPARPSIHQIAYLIDRWPDKRLPFIERELREMEQRNISIVPLVCELNSAARFTPAMEQLVDRLNFLPDAMAIESDWRTNRALAQKLEEGRASENDRTPVAIFLRQARFALTLRKLLAEKKISHIHATSSRALVCALILQGIVDLKVSATIEPKPELPQRWIEAALRRCEGGRLSDRKLLRERGNLFLFDKASLISFPKRTLRLLEEKIGIDLTNQARFWQEWSELLVRWSRERADEKPKISR